MISFLASFSSVMTTILYIILALIVLLVMVTIHELGHYLVGKALKFKITEFSIGFGKALFQKTLKSGEIFSLRLVPLGGYCAFAGEDEDDPDPGAFNNQHPWKRLLVQFAGVAFNFISAIIFAFILLISFGYDVPQVSKVDPTSQAAQYLQEGDVIREIDDIKIDFVTSQTFGDILANYENGQTMTLTIQRDGETMDVTATALVIETEKGVQYGIEGINTAAYRFGFVESLARCVPLAAAMAWKVLVFLFMLITGQVGLSALSGPITTIGTMAEYTQANIANLFVFLPFISANLAIFNLLPIPALDGSRMIFTTIEWIRDKPINRKVEGWIHMGGLIALFALVIIVDLIHFLT